MCFGGSKKPAEPAAAPAPPLPAPDAPQIGETRKQETRDQFGADAPKMRVARKRTVPQIAPGGPIVM